MKPTTYNLIAIALVLAVLVFGGKTATAPEPAGPTDPTLVAAVQPVATILADHREDGYRLGELYLALADVIERDQGKVISTTAQLRELHSRAGKLRFQQTGLAGKYPGLAEAVDKVLADRIGLDVVPLDAVKQKAAVDAFRALAWACEGGSRG